MSESVRQRTHAMNESVTGRSIQRRPSHSLRKVSSPVIHPSAVFHNVRSRGDAARRLRQGSISSPFKIRTPLFPHSRRVESRKIATSLPASRCWLSWDTRDASQSRKIATALRPYLKWLVTSPAPSHRRNRGSALFRPTQSGCPETLRCRQNSCPLRQPHGAPSSDAREQSACAR